MPMTVAITAATAKAIHIQVVHFGRSVGGRGMGSDEYFGASTAMVGLLTEIRDASGVPRPQARSSAARRASPETTRFRAHRHGTC
jgi:hypothetical protein